MTGPLPWQRDLWERLVARRDRLPHAILFVGMEGVGKNLLAEQLARLLLCGHPGERACGVCRGCELLAAGTHPDLHVVQPEAVFRSSDALLAVYAQRYAPRDKGKDSKDSKDSVDIRVDQIRALIEASQTRPQIAGRKVLILTPAETLNANAANSLLKLLEEPPADSQLLLVTSRPSRLPATVRSRCSRFLIAPPARAEAIAWLGAGGMDPEQGGVLLDLAGGSPLRARVLGAAGFLEQRAQRLGDLEVMAGGGQPLACAQRWKAQGAGPALAWLQTLVADLVRLGTGATPVRLYNHDVTARLRPLGKGLHLKNLFEFLETVTAARNLIGTPLDELLLLEDVLIRWSRLRRETPGG